MPLSMGPQQYCDPVSLVSTCDNRVCSHLLRILHSVFSRVLRNSTPRFVGPTDRRSVSPLVRHTLLFWVFVVFALTTPAQMVK